MLYCSLPAPPRGSDMNSLSVGMSNHHGPGNTGTPTLICRGSGLQGIYCVQNIIALELEERNVL